MADFSWVQLGIRGDKLIAVTEESHRKAGEKIKDQAAELTALKQANEELEADKERLDYLIEQCYLPDDHPTSGVFMVVDEESLSFGSYTGRTEEDRAAVRVAISKAIAMEKPTHDLHR
jgi:hypothetical protein